MVMPLDNSVRSQEAGPSRSEPVVEFGKKKSAAAVDSIEDNARMGSHGADARELFRPSIDILPQVALPRDANKPLVTAGERYSKEALEAYRGLRTRLLKSQATQGFRSIAISSVGRMDGKTITAFNLACCCAQVENFSVLLIDGDLRNRTLTRLINGLPSTGLADVMSRRALCEEAVVKTDIPNLYLMGAGDSETASADLFSTEKWSEVIRWSEKHFKMVLVDALSMTTEADFELIAPECDGVLLVVRARNTPREALKGAIDQLDASKLVGVVWNGAA